MHNHLLRTFYRTQCLQSRAKKRTLPECQIRKLNPRRPPWVKKKSRQTRREPKRENHPKVPNRPRTEEAILPAKIPQKKGTQGATPSRRRIKKKSGSRPWSNNLCRSSGRQSDNTTKTFWARIRSRRSLRTSNPAWGNFWERWSMVTLPVRQLRSCGMSSLQRWKRCSSLKGPPGTWTPSKRSANSPADPGQSLRRLSRSSFVS